ncbi:MAG TPA: amidohydrolase family protein [Vicinamibacterales bacterium]|jgi:predicted TIM-barrel fold metal-dependent hydrolase|nr:amidohydrolase family protein [Vicinamibacterales bacterium]
MRITDAHIHIQPFHMMPPSIAATFWKGKANREELEGFAADPGKLLARMDADGIERVGLINYVSPDLMGFTADANPWMVRYASTDPSRLIAFGSVHPRFSNDVAGDTRRVIDAGARALKVHPPHQLVRANAYQDGIPQLASLYRVAEECRIPVTIHTGTSVFPGARSRLGDPMDVDDVAIDFPNLTILLAHGGRPLWMEHAFFVVRRHPNVFLEVSGIPPARLLEYFPRLEELADKTVWGTDWPSPGIKSMRTNVDAFLALPVSGETKRKILHDNAARVWPR